MVHSISHSPAIAPASYVFAVMSCVEPVTISFQNGTGKINNISFRKDIAQVGQLPGTFSRASLPSAFGKERCRAATPQRPRHRHIRTPAVGSGYEILSSHGTNHLSGFPLRKACSSSDPMFPMDCCLIIRLLVVCCLVSVMWCFAFWFLWECLLGSSVFLVCFIGQALVTLTLT